MRPAIYALSLLLAFSPEVASAACSVDGNYQQLSGNQIASLLGSRTACVPPAGPPWQNQEAHTGTTSGNIVDFKKGPSDPIDPSKTIGTYSISGGSGNGTITYSYTGGGTFSYTVFGTPPFNTPKTYDFCAGATPLAVAVKSGSGGC
jgi:hypothetical protein